MSARTAAKASKPANGEHSGTADNDGGEAGELIKAKARLG
jgi:hypothetical protein